MGLEQKMKQQQQLSQQQLFDIQQKLAQITAIQQSQDAQQKSLDQQLKELEQQQKQQLLEQHIQIQSLSDNQMYTQKQLLEAHKQLQATQAQTKNVNENIQSLQQMQHQQAMQQQLTEQQIQQKLAIQSQQLDTQSQLQQLAQIAAANQQQFPTHIPPQNGGNNWMQMPSFFNFGTDNKANLTLSDMDMENTKEEKSNIPMINSDEDDEDVLGWNNDYGNPLRDNPKLLKTKDIVGKGKFMPNESRECGWLLSNTSKSMIKCCAQLHCIGGDKEEYGMRMKVEKEYSFSLEPGEDIYILIEVMAPSMPGKYCAFYQLIMEDVIKIGDMLEVCCEVEPQFNAKKEKSIEQIIKMGFDNRKKVIA